MTTEPETAGANCITHCLHDMGDGIWMRCCWCQERRAHPRPAVEADAYHNRSHAVPGPFWSKIRRTLAGAGAEGGE